MSTSASVDLAKALSPNTNELVAQVDFISFKGETKMVSPCWKGMKGERRGLFSWLCPFEIGSDS